ncbi:unnamed protein product [Hymenolepis diminuta]|uniref:Phosphorylated adapter RNA export protein n=1 Tax=Hymenolepis diminuta TaxID=6216 RepID=A0A0R3STR8_HYMDI|nr:unnamed protein product [Hymenolepis diminuta]VUZ48500.1 unnamed protein product [Hymenolepis diminuta]
MDVFGSRELSSGEVSSASSDGELPPKIIRRNFPQSEPQSKKFKNTVWQSVLYENTLENAFKSTDLNSKEISVERGEESYAFNISDIDSDLSGPDIMQPKTCRKRKRKNAFPPRKYDTSISRSYYGVNFASSPEEVAKAIVDILGEQRVDLVDKIVQTLGVKRALEFCYLTEDIQNLGGLPTADGARRRTPGGTYFFIIRESPDISKAEKKTIFREDAAAKMRKKRIQREQRRKEKLQALAATSPSSSILKTTEVMDEGEIVDIENIPSPNIEIE